MQFALDQVSDLRFDTSALNDRGIRMVKVPAALLLGEQAHAGRTDIAPADLSTFLARSGITLIAERVELDRTVADLIELEVAAAQGFIFSPPRPVKAEVFNEPPPASEAAPAGEGDDLNLRASVDETVLSGSAPAATDANGEERKPFRAFLRRATA